MICSRAIMEAAILSKRNRDVKSAVARLLRRTRRVSGVLRLAVSVAEIQIAQVNRQRHRRAQDAHGIALVNRKITEHEQTPERAAFPEPEGDHAFPRALRRDPLD